MRVDIDGFVMQISETRETLGERARCGTISRMDVMIVLLPGGQVIPEDKEGTLDTLLSLLDGFHQGSRGGLLALADGHDDDCPLSSR